MSEIVRRDPDHEPPMIKLLRQYEPDLALALPDGMTEDRFKSIVLNQVRINKQLLNVEPLTLVASVMLSAQLGLEPGPPMGLSWIIPRRNRGQLEASMQIGYRGLVQLAYRSGNVKRIEAHIVEEGDDFDYRFGVGGWAIDWKPLGEPGRDWTHVFCVAETVQGAEMVEIMTKAEVEAHRNRYSPQWDKGGSAWKSNEPEMARKVVTAKLCRQLPMSSEFRMATVADGMTPRELRPDLVGSLALEASQQEETDNEQD
jgi:recombination protein RecT